MGSMMIDGRRVKFTDEPNVLAVIRKAGIDIPTLCYHSELSIYGDLILPVMAPTGQFLAHLEHPLHFSGLIL